MILPKELERIAKKQQTSLLNVSREYLQAVFLNGFYRQSESADFLFKGGTALRLIYRSPRYSEDLDFDGLVYDCRRFEALLEGALVYLEKSGLAVDLRESKTTSGGCLAIFTGKVGELRINIQLEVSLRRPKDVQGQLVLVETEFYPPFNVTTLSAKQLAAGKIKALLARQKPRDFYDLYFLLRKGIELNLKRNQREKILEAVEELDPQRLAEELSAFLPQSHRLIYKDLPAVLKAELERA